MRYIYPLLFYQSLAPFDKCKCKDGSSISVIAIILLEPLFFDILKFFVFFFFFYPILFYRFVRLQGLQAVINEMVPEMTGKAGTMCIS